MKKIEIENINNEINEYDILITVLKNQSDNSKL
jgi:hypothetical protein